MLSRPTPCFWRQAGAPRLEGPDWTPGRVRSPPASWARAVARATAFHALGHRGGHLAQSAARFSLSVQGRLGKRGVRRLLRTTRERLVQRPPDACSRRRAGGSVETSPPRRSAADARAAAHVALAAMRAITHVVGKAIGSSRRQTPAARPRREPSRTACAMSHSHSKATASMSGARRPRSGDERPLRAHHGERRRYGRHERERERERECGGLGEFVVSSWLRSCPSRVSRRSKRGGAMAGVARPPGASARGRRSPPAWLLRQPLLARPDGTDRAGAEADPGGTVAADGHAVRRRV